MRGLLYGGRMGKTDVHVALRAVVHAGHGVVHVGVIHFRVVHVRVIHLVR